MLRTGPPMEYRPSSETYRLFSVQSNPCTTISPVWLAHYKAKYEVVLIGRFDYRRMCPVILTKRECIVPSWSGSVMNKVA